MAASSLTASCAATSAGPILVLSTSSTRCSGRARTETPGPSRTSWARPNEPKTWRSPQGEKSPTPELAVRLDLQSVGTAPREAPGAELRSSRPAHTGLQLVHRAIRHRRLARAEGTAGRAGVRPRDRPGGAGAQVASRVSQAANLSHCGQAGHEPSGPHHAARWHPPSSQAERAPHPGRPRLLRSPSRRRVHSRTPCSRPAPTTA